MTPEQKAKELKYKMENFTIYPKRCALIAVDEIIASNPIAFDEDDNCIEKNWWQEVKTEIEKL
jgi:hypothetical protein